MTRIVSLTAVCAGAGLIGFQTGRLWKSGEHMLAFIGPLGVVVIIAATVWYLWRTI